MSIVFNIVQREKREHDRVHERASVRGITIDMEMEEKKRKRQQWLLQQREHITWANVADSGLFQQNYKIK